MHVIRLVGFVLLLSTHTARAASLEPLLQAAGLLAMSEHTPAPDFRLPDTTGYMHRLHEQRGKVVFLNFWATWCPPCVQEMRSWKRCISRSVSGRLWCGPWR